MSTNRCFETLDTTVVNGSDRTNSRRQETIYSEMQYNSAITGPNPLKKNGYRYNQNFLCKKFTFEEKSQYRLASAKNYDLLLDITKGKRFANPVKNVGHNRYKMWGGNVMQVNYNDKPPYTKFTWTTQQKNSNTLHMLVEIDDAASNKIVDQCNNIFYSPCYFSTPGHTPPWIRNVATKKPIFKNTYYYLQGANADPYRGMSYPEEIYFEHQEPCVQDDTACLKNTNCTQ